MKKDNKIRRMIGTILLAFFVSFTINVLSAYFRGNELNIVEELFDVAVFVVIYCPITFYMQRSKKADKADEKEEPQ